MLAQRPTHRKNRWQAKPFASTCALLTTLLFSHASFAADARADYDLDDDGLIEINDLADLKEIRYNPDGKTLYGSNAGCPDAQDGTVNGGCNGFELTTDLDFDTNQDGVMDANDAYWRSGYGWRSIGLSSTNSRFSAIFEGNGHVIRNLFIKYDGGLFGYTQNAVIRNVGLTGPLMSVTGSGSLVGHANDSEIKNVFNTGPVQNKGGRAGGLIGVLNSSTLENAVNSGPVTGSYSVGGLVGYADGDSRIRNGLSTGWVHGNTNTGGLVGSEYYTSNLVIENSYWATDTSGQATSIGESEANSSVGLPMSILQCAVAANTHSGNSDCVSADGSIEGLNGPVTLFNGWNQALLDGQSLWNFGDNTQPPSIVFKGIVYRDTDADGSLDVEDAWPLNSAASKDIDRDGYPDVWSHICDANCIADSSLQLDHLPGNADAWQDEDLDGLPDSWGTNCDTTCQNESDLVLDAFPNDTDNDGIDDLTDTDDNNDGIIDIDADSDGLVDIDTLEKLNAMRYQLDGEGLRKTNNSDLDQSGCPEMIHQGVLVKRCIGYELITDVDFDTNQDGIMDANDTYWNNSYGWYPIGSGDNRFSATFEGNGHVIRNLFIKRLNSSDIGLFGSTQNALIRNVVLTGPLMSVAGVRNMGSLAGTVKSSEITNVFNTGAVQGTGGRVGGLVGELSSSILENAFNSGPVTGGENVGGLVGYVTSNSDQQPSFIRNGLSTGFVTGHRDSGGLIGYSYYKVIDNSYWASDASGQTTSAGESETNNYVGLPLATLQCAVAANTNSSNSSCVSADGVTEGLTSPVTLFKDWEQATYDGQVLWDFGTGTQLPALVLKRVYRDSDGDGSLDSDDAWPNNRAASIDFDSDGHPDKWRIDCDSACVEVSGLTLDQFPSSHAAWQDDDLDGLPESWADTCDIDCQINSGLVLDNNPNDTDNDGLTNAEDYDDNNDGITDADTDNNGLIEINTLERLNAIRYQQDGIGLRLTDNSVLDQSGCPATLYQGQVIPRCSGYELTTDLDFDSNQDGIINSNDSYWNNGYGWSPIDEFTATFEGNGHVIRNLFIKRLNYNRVGLFSVTKNAVIRNVGLTGPLMFVSGRTDTGALVGFAYKSVIKNVFNTGPVNGPYNGYAGGLIGSLSSSILENAFNSGTVIGYKYIGGLVGSIYSDSASQFSIVRNGLSIGLVEDNFSHGTDIGGLIGNHGSKSDYTVVENSYWASDASGLDTSVLSSETNSYVGLPLATLQCAINANTHYRYSRCVSSDGSAEGLTGPVTLFKDWDQAMLGSENLWDFGNNTQVPVLVLNGRIYRDSDGDFIYDSEDAYPYISLAGRADTDSDGSPNECDESCTTLGMAADTDDDNDGVLDEQDVYPLISLQGRLDTDNDGIPNECGESCTALGMSADLDDDNDGVLDTEDIYPLISLDDRLDTDSDGIPNECDESCVALGMSADLDNDNDGVLDENDAFPLIAIGELLDTDNDGAPNTCDVDCVALGMSVDLDNDNDGVLDENDAFPLIAIGELLDTDNDGIPNECDVDCLALGMSADLDDENDGVLDVNDAFPLIAIGNLLDTDNDGAPDTCDVDCLALGMRADLDDDNDGILDVNDAYPLITIGDLLDTDKDGAPNTCDVDCLALGMTADSDDDNDGVLDDNDVYPLIAIGGLLDTDNDGVPNACDTSCVELGMSADLDDDNDGLLDVNDTYPLVAIGELLDSDNDGAPNVCDVNCLELGMTADLDDDNDGLLDVNDAYPLIAIGELLDTDNDGAPDTCDTSCVELGMSADLDDDNDGVLDDNDAYPLIAIGGLLDTDNDGVPNACDASCVELGMSADLDDDNDGVLDVNDVYPLIAIGELLDTDNDGAPDTCDTSCVELGMSADLDDDNDGVLDSSDAYPLISLDDRVDSDRDGIPNQCDANCLELGMTADLDDDNDGVLDISDAFPLVAIGDLLDTDNDGAPNTCNVDCLALGMSADLDDDNDGVLDTNDVYPLIAIGELLDTDNDGAPNACDLDCLALGMVDDLDDDNDGVLDSSDAYPLISLGDRVDSDRDGIPNQCDANCFELGMAVDLDDDNDGLLDVNDTYPLVAIGELLDTDNDGAPNTCDVDCLALGMSADEDDDNDGVLDINDAFPLIAIGNLLDTDNDGAPDTCDANCLALNMSADLDDDNDGVLDINDHFPLDNSEHNDFDGDGIGDVADLDDDNDGVNDVNDPNLGEDNGKPEIINVPSIDPVAVTTENGDAFELLVDDNFLNAFTTYDAVDSTFNYEASLNGNVLAIDENDIMLIPAGRQAVQVVAIDAAGNRSEPVEMVAIVYPQVRFEQAASIIGENSTTNIKVSLTGDSPDYPVVVNFAINEGSDVNQADLDTGFDITAQHQLMIEAGDAEALNRDGLIKIGIIDDNESENDELLIIDLLSAKLESETDDDIESLFVIDETNKQHELTVTYENLAPVVNLKLEQNGIEVANVQQDAGMVSITAIVQDGNGNDVHTLTWDLNNLGLNAPLGNTLNFSPASLPVSTYEISVIATDNGVGQLSDDAVIQFDVVAPPEEPVDGDSKETEEPKSSGGSGGAVSLWLMLLLFALVSGIGVRRVNAFS